jgi:cytochrome bd-type quinol oxidase subunit 1
MSVVALLYPVAEVVAGVVAWTVDKTPEDKDVKAGWTAFVIFLLLIGAVVFLGFSLVKQLRKAQAAKDAGVYGEDDGQPVDGADEPENHQTS